jgi:hypothetical protein
VPKGVSLPNQVNAASTRDKIGFVEISEIKELSRARGQRREIVVTSWLDAKCISLPASVDRLRRAR